MILVAAGTVAYPFKRLVDAAMAFYRDRPQEPVIIQSGTYNASSKRKHITVKPYFPASQMIKLYQKASLIICAAGEASILQILTYSRQRPILVPRLPQFREHVDDQQLRLTRYLVKRRLAYGILDIGKLSHLVETIGRSPVTPKKALTKRSSASRRLIERLVVFTDRLSTGGKDESFHQPART
jgi:UDP-N-acetylglucosamine transferase subunit ALG13